ncbi:RNA polymerase sigma factor [Candidatus Marithrix sp. Canyon 246]|uniref:RNA polymerase sigma factor n=1 Tax=Candidatus Marithrix sp. Canyon 246 TaxID=1827136 RepID=UPI000849F420|nr:sigma factor [Candidatus Marithrix sp. Canyon 246]
MNDKEALELMRKNNPKGLEFLHRKYYSRVRKAILSIKKKPISEASADEICNDTFFQFHHTIKGFKEQCSVLTWLGTLAIQETSKRLRKEKFMIKNPLAKNEIDIFFLEMEKLEKDDCYQYCIRTNIAYNTNPLYKNCYDSLMFFYKGHSIKETSQKINRSLSATTSFFSNCRKTFKQISSFKECWEDCNKN